MTRSNWPCNVNGHCDVEWFFCQHTLYRGPLSVVEDKSVHIINKDTSSVEVMHESITNTCVPEKCRHEMAKPEVHLDCSSGTPVFELARDYVLCGCWCIFADFTTDADGVLLNDMLLPYSLNSKVVRNTSWSSVASFLAPHKSQVYCRMDGSNALMEISFSAYSSYTSTSGVLSVLHAIHSHWLRKLGDWWFLSSDYYMGRLLLQQEVYNLSVDGEVPRFNSRFS